jgi:hypothetical protein
MMKFIKKHPIAAVGGAVVALMLWPWVYANVIGPPKPQPSPGPTPPSPQPNPQQWGQLTSANNPFPIFPGASSLTIGQGSGFSLQLQPGATWDTEGGYPPVSQQGGGSVLGGSVVPMVPTVGGSAPQAWDNVTGNGVLVIYWKDASGAPQATNIAVTTTGGAHGLGA